MRIDAHKTCLNVRITTWTEPIVVVHLWPARRQTLEATVTIAQRQWALNIRSKMARAQGRIDAAPTRAPRHVRATFGPTLPKEKPMSFSLASGGALIPSNDSRSEVALERIAMIHGSAERAIHAQVDSGDRMPSYEWTSPEGRAPTMGKLEAGDTHCPRVRGPWKKNLCPREYAYLQAGMTEALENEYWRASLVSAA